LLFHLVQESLREIYHGKEFSLFTIDPKTNHLQLDSQDDWWEAGYAPAIVIHFSWAMKDSSLPSSTVDLLNETLGRKMCPLPSLNDSTLSVEEPVVEEEDNLPSDKGNPEDQSTSNSRKKVSAFKASLSSLEKKTPKWLRLSKK
jgi:hypothetical protein